MKNVDEFLEMVFDLVDEGESFTATLQKGEVTVEKTEEKGGEE